MNHDLFFQILTIIIAAVDNGSANTIGSMANQGYTSISVSRPNSALHIPIGAASAR